MLHAGREIGGLGVGKRGEAWAGPLAVPAEVRIGRGWDESKQLSTAMACALLIANVTRCSRLESEITRSIHCSRKGTKSRY